MFKKVICACLAGLFLSSSLILPFGDFSLLKEIPEMYRNYTRITSPEEAGTVDFIGDYLLHGKDILGHNKHDKIPAKGNEVQFQHAANPLHIVFTKFLIVPTANCEFYNAHLTFNQQFKSFAYKADLFKPPLT